MMKGIGLVAPAPAVAGRGIFGEFKQKPPA
jgi:hypothetical protein